MAMSDEVAGEIELLMHCRYLLTQSIANRLQLESDAGEALRKRVVHFVSQASALFQNGAESPMLCAMIEEVRDQSEEDDGDREGNDVSGTPPRRPGEHLYILGCTQQQDRSE